MTQCSLKAIVDQVLSTTAPDMKAAGRLVIAEEIERQASALFGGAAPPVRGDREALRQQYARIIDPVTAELLKLPNCECDPNIISSWNRALTKADAILSLQPSAGEREAVYRIDHDGFEGTTVGRYTTREGKRGVVLQQIGTKVVHVYGEKWLTAPVSGV